MIPHLTSNFIFGYLESVLGLNAQKIGALSCICIGYHELFWIEIQEKCAYILSWTQNGSESGTI